MCTVDGEAVWVRTPVDGEPLSAEDEFDLACTQEPGTVPTDPRTTAVVAQRRHLPGVRPQLRRRRRRRHRRPRGRPQPAPLPRDLGVDALWFNPGTPSPLADGGYDVADYRAIDPAFGTSRRPSSSSPRRSRSTSARSSTSSPTTSRPAPWFQAALAAGPAVPERDRFWFRPGRARTATSCRRRLDLGLQGRRLDPHQEPRWHARRWYLHLFTPTSPTSTGTTPTSAPSTRRSCASGSTGASPASASTPRPGVKDAAPEVPTTSPRASTRTSTATSSTTSTARGGGSPTPTGTRVLIGECGSDVERFARYLRPDELHTAFNFDFMARRGSRGAARVDRRDARQPTRRSARRHLGPLQPRRHAARDALRREDSSFAFAAKRFGRPPTSTSDAVAPAPQRCSSRPCPARSTCTRATSSACPSRGLPLEELQDPMHSRSGGIDPGPRRMRPAALGRDESPFGFRAQRAAPPGCPQPGVVVHTLGRR